MLHLFGIQTPIWSFSWRIASQFFNDTTGHLITRSVRTQHLIKNETRESQ
jgi:hypothetical protein